MNLINTKHLLEINNKVIVLSNSLIWYYRYYALLKLQNGSMQNSNEAKCTSILVQKWLYQNEITDLCQKKSQKITILRMSLSKLILTNLI